MEPEETASITVKLARVEVKIDQIIEIQRIRGEDHETRLRVLESHQTSDHDARLSALEHWRYALPTTAVVLAVASTVIAVLNYLGK
ncbi:hypothetical protein OV450_3433 [Actinobacteria bacterium OV450]|nr:hypothetical protein OV450_3433 [Actinobacteria bacterium OV450]